jgi:hypothetical protein
MGNNDALATNLRAWLRKKEAATMSLHKAIFKIAILSKEAGMPAEQAELLCKAYAAGKMARRAPEREIRSAVACAYSGEVKPQGPRFPAPMLELMAEVDAYPVPVPYPPYPHSSPEDFLDRMFPGDPLLCIGATAFAMDTRPLSQWRGLLAGMQFLVPSPMTSPTGPRKEDGQESFHAESNTGPRIFLVTEFDHATKPQQMARIRALEARGTHKLALIVDSAGKSLHAYWKTSGDAHADFIFFSHATKLGADERLWLRSQFARLPAGQRDGRKQEVLLWQP